MAVVAVLADKLPGAQTALLRRLNVKVQTPCVTLSMVGTVAVGSQR